MAYFFCTNTVCCWYFDMRWCTMASLPSVADLQKKRNSAIREREKNEMNYNWESSAAWRNNAQLFVPLISSSTNFRSQSSAFWNFFLLLSKYKKKRPTKSLQRVNHWTQKCIHLANLMHATCFVWSLTSEIYLLLKGKKFVGFSENVKCNHCI